MKPKILIFSLAYYPHVGGAEVAIKEITDRLKDEYEFHVLCNRYDNTLPKMEVVGNVTVHRIGVTTKQPSMADLSKLPLHLNKALYQFIACGAARKLHKAHQFAAVWGMMAHATGVPAGKFKKAFPDVWYVLTLQEGDPPEYIEKKMKPFGKAFDEGFTRADVIQVISNFLGDWAKRKGFTGPVIRVPNAVNIQHFSTRCTEAECNEIRKHLEVSLTDILLVTTSRLVHKNGVDDVIRAMATLPTAVKFVIYGTGPDEMMLRDLAISTGVSNRVLFAGHIDHAVMPKHLQACDIFIRPSRSEGMGNSFIEAMAAGLPVIATQAGGIKDFLFSELRNPDRPATGWVVDVDNPSQISAAVEDIIARPEMVTQVTQAAQAMVRKEYDWDLVAKRMKSEVFDKVIS